MIFKILFRTVLFYILLIFAYKIMGKRELGELGIFDFAISILISQLIAISIENYKDPILYTLLPLFILIFFQVLLSFITLKNKKFRDFIDGVESIIILNGKINFKEMTKQRYSLSDLLNQLRDKDIRSIEEVDFAILESNGKLSVFKKDDKDKDVFPLPLIVDGRIEEKNLKLINKDTVWLNKELKNKHLDLTDVFYLFYKNNQTYYIKRNSID